MPLLYRPPTTDTPAPSWPRVPVPPAKRIVWVGPDGSVHRLTDGAEYVSVTGRSGLGLVVPDLVTDRTMSGPALLRDHRPTPRVINIPLVVQGADQATYLAAHRALGASFRHKSGDTITPGRLRVELADGSWREIHAYYQGGLEPVESVLDDMMWLRQEHPNLEWYCPDPYFYGPEQNPSWRIVASGRAFYPIYPIKLNPSQFGGAAIVTNPGDADSYPVWEFVGPGTVTVTNTDTDEEFGFDASIPAGRTVTVDARPPDIEPETGLTATDDLGGDWWPNFDGLPSLFHLPPGVANLQITMTSATNDSLVRLRFAPRYQAGW